MQDGTPTIYLHIGTHKTGTSAIQDFCYDNAPELREQGYVYPRRPTYLKGHHPVAWSLGVPHPRADGTVDGQALFEHFLDVVDRAEATSLVLSSEGFEFLDRPEAVADVAGRARVLILTYLRRQDRYLASIYNHHLRIPSWRYAGSITDFFEDQDLDSRFDYATRLLRWVDAFGREAVRAVSYDRIAASRRSVVADFTERIGADTSGMRGRERVVNPSLGPYESEVLRSLNERDLDTETHLEHVAFLRWAGAQGILTSRYGPPPPAVPPGLRDRIIDRYQSSNRRLIELFPSLGHDFATVGDRETPAGVSLPPVEEMLEALEPERPRWKEAQGT